MVLSRCRGTRLGGRAAVRISRALHRPTIPAAAAAMRDLAERLVPVYQDPDPDRYLANLSALQMAADNYAAADVSRQALRDRRRRSNVHRPVGRGVIYDIYAYAKALEAENRVSFADGFTRAFHEVVGRLDDHDAYAVTRWLELSPAVFREALQKALDQQRTNDTIGQAEAVELIWKYLGLRCLSKLRSLGRYARGRGGSPPLHDRGRCPDRHRPRGEHFRDGGASEGFIQAAAHAARVHHLRFEELRQGVRSPRLRRGGGLHPRKTHESRDRGAVPARRRRCAMR